MLVLFHFCIAQSLCDATFALSVDEDQPKASLRSTLSKIIMETNIPKKSTSNVWMDMEFLGAAPGQSGLLK